MCRQLPYLQMIFAELFFASDIVCVSDGEFNEEKSLD